MLGSRRLLLVGASETGASDFGRGERIASKLRSGQVETTIPRTTHTAISVFGSRSRPKYGVTSSFVLRLVEAICRLPVVL